MYPVGRAVHLVGGLTGKKWNFLVPEMYRKPHISCT